MERNRYEFSTKKGGSTTEVTLDLTPFTDNLWKEGVLPYFEVHVLAGTRTVNDGRVTYLFNLPVQLAHILESAIVTAILQMQGQNN